VRTLPPLGGIGPRAHTVLRCRRGAQHKPTPEEAAYDVGATVMHEEFGRGSVVDVDADTDTVLFEAQGYRTLSNEVVTEKGLLEVV
jgi:ATP-dependent DNA helicase RecQ